MSRVSFTVPSSIPLEQLPPSGIMKAKWILTGLDGVKIEILRNTDTYYDHDTHTFESLDSGKTLFQFNFPANTTNESETYTTPAKSIYVFSDKTATSLNNGLWIKNMTSGTITITPAVVDQTPLQDTSSGTLSMSDIAKDSPFHSLLLVVYKLAMDMFAVFIFWTLFISISCWSRVKSEYLYPYDVHKYPFIFYDKDEAYDPMKTDGLETCTLIGTEDRNKKIEQQKKQFDALDKLDRVVRDILNAVHPNLLNRDPQSVNMFSGYLLSNCTKSSEVKCTYDYVVYFVLKIVMNNYLYCNMVLFFIHEASFFLYEHMIKGMKDIFTIPLFAIVLLGAFLGIGAMNKEVIRLFHIHFERETTIGTICLNQFLKLLVTFLSCFLCLIIPLSFILVFTTLLATAYTVFTTLIGSVNMTIGIISFLTLAFSLTSYILIGLRLAQGSNPLEILESMISNPASLTHIFSLFGVVLPILMGIGYSCWVGFTLFTTFFKFVKIDEVVESLKTTSASVVMVALILLMLIVKEILGDTYTVMTFIIIILIGVYVATIVNKTAENG